MTARHGSKAAATDAQRSAGHRNEVIVAGRLSAPATTRELPSGDEVVTWRLAVDNPSATGGRKVDVVDCTAFAARVRRQALSWSEGDVVEVAGALRRRFWRGTGGVQSRCEIEVESASRRVARAARAGKSAAEAPTVSRRRKPA